MKNRAILISLAIILVLIVVAFGSIVFMPRGKGSIIIQAPGAQLRIRHTLSAAITITSRKEPVSVPARVYAPHNLLITGEKDGRTWQLTSNGPWGELRRIEVRTGQTTSLKCGPPFRIIPGISKTPGVVGVDFQILGCAGEWYSPVVMKNGQRAPAPRVEILDEQGKAIHSGQFSYG